MKTPNPNQSGTMAQRWTSSTGARINRDLTTKRMATVSSSTHAPILAIAATGLPSAAPRRAVLSVPSQRLEAMRRLLQHHPCRRMITVTRAGSISSRVDSATSSITITLGRGTQPSQTASAWLDTWLHLIRPMSRPRCGFI